MCLRIVLVIAAAIGIIVNNCLHLAKLYFILNVTQTSSHFRNFTKDIPLKVSTKLS